LEPPGRELAVLVRVDADGHRADQRVSPELARGPQAAGRARDQREDHVIDGHAKAGLAKAGFNREQIGERQLEVGVFAGPAERAIEECAGSDEQLGPAQTAGSQRAADARPH